MKKKISKYIDEPVGALKRVTDFLPPPHKLFPAEQKVKITLTLDKKTVSFFKTSAHQLGAKYQRLMREVLKKYSQQFSH